MHNMEGSFQGLTYEKILAQATDRLILAGVTDAQLDAWYLLEDTFGIRRADYFLKKRECPAQIPGCWEDRLQLRCQRMPLAYILGHTEFMGLPFVVEPGVLIPRQDTETLVEWVLEDKKKAAKAGVQTAGISESAQEPLTLLDMCTGSGCIGLSLAKLGGYATTLSDLSPRAIQVSRRNRGGLDLEEQVEICHGDLFASLPEGRKFDVIVSNPPYIETAVIEGLQEEVRDHEPRMALDGMEDGLFFYRRLAKEAPQWLKPGGKIYLEIGYDQGETVPALLRDAGFVNVTVRKDLAGNDRVVRGEYPHV